MSRNGSLRNCSALKEAPHSFGFLGGRPYEALLPHARNRSLLTVDFKDAFPSIYRRWIFELFRDRDYSWYVSDFLASITTHEGRMTQGSAMSPKIFELLCGRIDYRLGMLAEKFGGAYTRYADNIFFSIPGKRIERGLVNAVLKRISFETHKLRIRTIPGNAIHALGLVIRDGRVCNSREFKQTLRKRIHHVRWLLDHGGSQEVMCKAWGKVCGSLSHAQKDTLPEKLLHDYEDIARRCRHFFSNT